MDPGGQTPEQRIAELTGRVARLERATDRARGDESSLARRVRAQRYMLPVLGGLTSTFLGWPHPTGWRRGDQPVTNAYWNTFDVPDHVPSGWLWVIGTLGLTIVIAGSIRAFRREPTERHIGLAAVGGALAVTVVITPVAMGVWSGARVGDLAGPFLMFVSAVAFAVVCLTDKRWPPPVTRRPGRSRR